MFLYTPDFLPSSVVMIGCGGTGSRIMPMLTQLVRTCIKSFNPSAWLERLPIYIVDGDTVEEKNLLRQNFVQRDVGHSKAGVLATRYGNAFGVPIYPSISFIGEKGEPLLFQGLPDNEYFTFDGSIVILAVDSAQARRTILDFIFNSAQGCRNESCFILDVGNEDAFGQIKFFTQHLLSETRKDEITRLREQFPSQIPIEQKVNYIPFDIEYYQSLGGSSAELSCADLPQTLAINAMMASLVVSITQNFLYLKPMNFDGIRFSMNGSVATEFNTPQRWLNRAKKTNFNYSSYTPEIYNSITNARFRVFTEDTQAGIYQLLTGVKDTYSKVGLKVVNRELVPINPPLPPTPSPVSSEPIPLKIPELVQETPTTTAPVLPQEIPPLSPLTIINAETIANNPVVEPRDVTITVTPVVEDVVLEPLPVSPTTRRTRRPQPHTNPRI
jgi:molybdopterin/thiamine biosynthesis adenylyltransferase